MQQLRLLQPSFASQSFEAQRPNKKCKGFLFWSVIDSKMQKLAVSLHLAHLGWKLEIAELKWKNPKKGRWENSEDTMGKEETMG